MERFFLIPAFGLYAVAALLIAIRFRRPGIAVFFAATGLNLTAVIIRGATAGHFPFSNMFETMMTLGVCMVPFFLLSELAFKSKAGWIDPLLAAIIVFPSCFIFEDRIKPLPPALQSPLFFPHVSTYLLAYAALAKGMLLSVVATVKRRGQGWADTEREAWQFTGLGFPMLTAGLLLGAYWAKQAWGDYWAWDPKEVWSLNTWLVYLIYLHVRVRTRGRSRWCDVLNIAGFAAIVITLLIVNLTRIFGTGLHSYAS